MEWVDAYVIPAGLPWAYMVEDQEGCILIGPYRCQIPSDQTDADRVTPRFTRAVVEEIVKDLSEHEASKANDGLTVGITSDDVIWRYNVQALDDPGWPVRRYSPDSEGFYMLGAEEIEWIPNAGPDGVIYNIRTHLEEVRRLEDSADPQDRNMFWYHATSAAIAFEMLDEWLSTGRDLMPSDWVRK